LTNFRTLAAMTWSSEMMLLTAAIVASGDCSSLPSLE